MLAVADRLAEGWLAHVDQFLRRDQPLELGRRRDDVLGGCCLQALQLLVFGLVREAFDPGSTVDINALKIAPQQEIDHPVVAVALIPAVDRFRKDPPVVRLDCYTQRHILTILAELHAGKDTTDQLRQRVRLQFVPLRLTDRRLLIVPDPQSQALDVEVDVVAVDFVLDDPLSDDRAQGRRGQIPGVLVPDVGLVVDRPFSPAAIRSVPAEAGVPVLPETSPEDTAVGGVPHIIVCGFLEELTT